MKHIISTLFVFSLLYISLLDISGQNPVSTAGSEPGMNQVRRVSFPMRELSRAELDNTATGIYELQHNDDYYHFQRFPPEALKVFEASETYHIRAEASSGVRLKFRSDTRELLIEGKVLENSPQTEPFIILCNDSLLAEFPARDDAGEFGHILKMPGKGENIIEICFPAYAKGTIRKLQIEENSSLIPLKRRGVYFAMGNSITQQGGRYMGYADIIARELDLELHEAGIGGHIFDAESLPFAYLGKPSLITLAYGTNDWSGGRPIDNARIFLDRITSLYPSTPIYLLEPIRRYRPLTGDGKELANNKDGMSLMDYRHGLRSIAKKYPTVKVINYKKLMPDEPSLFSDGVHPTHKGQIVFGNNLLRILKKYDD